MVTGRNGSGKSTLLRVLATAAAPTAGRRAWPATTSAASAAEVRRRVALLGHHSYLYEALTARENLEVAARFLGALAAARVRRRCCARSAWPSARTIRCPPSRPACASAWPWRARCCRTREVVLLDEPYGELDPPGFRLLDAVLDELQARGAPRC